MKPGLKIMRLSIIIPTHNRFQKLSRCVLEIRKQLGKLDEIIICANCCNKATLKQIKKHLPSHNQTKIIYTAEKGINIARNSGIENSKGDYLVFIDDDAVPQKDWINKIQEKCKKNPMIFGGKILNYKNSIISNVQQFLFDDGMSKGDNKTFFTISGSNMIIHKSVFQTIGQFNEDYIYGTSETEFFRRASMKYNLSFYDTIIVYHEWTSNIFRYINKSFKMGKTQSRYLQSNKIMIKKQARSKYWLSHTWHISKKFNLIKRVPALCTIYSFKISFIIGKMVTR